jgi:hypothetical protein
MATAIERQEAHAALGKLTQDRVVAGHVVRQLARAVLERGGEDVTDTVGYSH